jgi:hypothetical protein
MWGTQHAAAGSCNSIHADCSAQWCSPTCTLLLCKIRQPHTSHTYLQPAHKHVLCPAAPCPPRHQQTAHGAIQFAAYEELKHLAGRAGSGGAGQPDRTLSSAEVSAYGAASKFLAAVSTYPTQVCSCSMCSTSEGSITLDCLCTRPLS